ncbi:MAG: hypothetical protein HXX17_06645 [Geobacteraceae bacterium]|nr:hypothetical protein [Geobacteraceae bacterium]
MGRKRKYTSSKVISIRISDEENQDISAIMASKRIETVTDLMREAIRHFKNNLQIEIHKGINQISQQTHGKQL